MGTCGVLLKEGDLVLKAFPKQIKYIVGNEAAERYSYYGMKSILIIFMTSHLLIDKNEAVSSYHMFSAACYLLPLLGAYLSDRYLGKYKTIISLSIVYCLGHLVLALFESKTGLYWGLGLIALGSGGIKPCVSAHVGDQFKKNEQELLKKVFDIFYWMINFGSFFATIITPWTYKYYGPQVAFGIPGVLMFLATWIFWLGRHHYVHVPPAGPQPNSILNVLWSGFRNRRLGLGFWGGAQKNHPQEAVDGIKAVISVTGLFVWISVFWALFDQSGSTWTLQAQQMDLNFAGLEWNESQIQALNPIMILLLIPFFSNVVYPFVEKLGIKLTPTRKMSAGMLLAALSFVMIGLIQAQLNMGHKLTVAWQFWPYLVITISEVLVSITGLEFSYTQAPRAMKSTLMSFWLVTVFIGNSMTAIIAKLNQFEAGSVGYFMFFAALMGGMALIFTYMTSRYKMRNYMEN